MRDRNFRSRDASAVRNGRAAAEDGRHALGAWVVGAVRRHPVDAFGFALMSALIAAVLVNALFLQSGKHPAPMRAIGSASAAAGEATGSFIAMPRPRPAEAAVPVKEAAVKEVAARETAQPSRPRGQVVSDIQKELARRGFYDGPIDGVYGPRMEAAIREFEQAAGVKPGAGPSESLLQLIAQSAVKADKKKTPPQAPATGRAGPPQGGVPPARVLAVQRTLAEFGYGQIKLTGVFDEATKAAVEKFEREHRLPVTGRISDRLMRELAAMTGRPLE